MIHGPNGFMRRFADRLVQDARGQLSVRAQYQTEDRLGFTLHIENQGSIDIANQLIEFSHGNGIEVALGGGRSYFLPNTVPDPEDTGEKGRRQDGRDLTQEWLDQDASAYVWSMTDFDAIDPRTTDHLLGLFERSHLPYTTLGYANGPGYRGGSRPDLTNVDTLDVSFLQEATVPMSAETHAAEDVALYATGPGAHLVHGAQEQTISFYVMVHALGLDGPRRTTLLDWLSVWF